MLSQVARNIYHQNFTITIGRWTLPEWFPDQSVAKTGINLQKLRSPLRYGTIHCQLLNNQLEEAEQQLEFLNDIATERNVKLCFLSSLHASKRRFDMSTLLEELDAEVAKLVVDAARRPFGTDFFVHLDPNLVLGCANLFLSQESGEPRSAADPR